VQKSYRFIVILKHNSLSIAVVCLMKLFGFSQGVMLPRNLWLAIMILHTICMLLGCFTGSSHPL